ncbi:hypothetical protein BC834DRAFT_382905 [Gloeopeniophorella convolvens]|nr:hypothetical protein BC834DRAFT_382905 [Gloeopeniophorella convolvens]
MAQEHRSPGTNARAFRSPLLDPTLPDGHFGAAVPQADGLNVAHQAHTFPHSQVSSMAPPWREMSPTISHSTHGWPQHIIPDPSGQHTIPYDLCNQCYPAMPSATNASTGTAPGLRAGYGANGYAYVNPTPRSDNVANCYVAAQNPVAHGGVDQAAQPPPAVTQAPQAPSANLVAFGDLAGRWMRIVQVEPNGYTGAARFVLEIV